MRRAIAALCVLGLAACDDAKTAAPSATTQAPPSAAPQAKSAAPATAQKPTARPSSSAQGEGKVEILKLTWASEIANKEPADELDHASPGDRVYAHLAVRNRTDKPRTLTVIFRVNGEDRSTVPLTVQSSWKYRTWAYNTLRDGDAGELTVEVIDDEGAVLATQKLPIQAKKAKGV